jgi:hypothetical protein
MRSSAILSGVASSLLVLLLSTCSQGPESIPQSALDYVPVEVDYLIHADLGQLHAGVDMRSIVADESFELMMGDASELFLPFLADGIALSGDMVLFQDPHVGWRGLAPLEDAKALEAYLSSEYGLEIQETQGTSYAYWQDRYSLVWSGSLFTLLTKKVDAESLLEMAFQQGQPMDQREASLKFTHFLNKPADLKIWMSSRENPQLLDIELFRNMAAGIYLDSEPNSLSGSMEFYPDSKSREVILKSLFDRPTGEAWENLGEETPAWLALNMPGTVSGEIWSDIGRWMQSFDGLAILGFHGFQMSFSGIKPNLSMQLIAEEGSDVDDLYASLKEEGIITDRGLDILGTQAATVREPGRFAAATTQDPGIFIEKPEAAASVPEEVMSQLAASPIQVFFDGPQLAAKTSYRIAEKVDYLALWLDQSDDAVMSLEMRVATQDEERMGADVFAEVVFGIYPILATILQ